MSSTSNNDSKIFPTGIDEIVERIAKIDPIAYGKSRNFINGAVTYLSPYISRGIISTKFVLSKVLDKGYSPALVEKFIQELAWRDYWQQVWVEKGDLINTDLKRPQGGIGNHGLPNAILQADTGITAIDKSISEFYRTGYMHNHLRMYVASITCNVAGSYWQFPAQWMYYHLLDADWASNALSWQWVAGSNSNKKYYANQENINKYCNTHQKNTFLDVAYSDFENLTAPDVLKDIVKPSLTTPLPGKEIINIDVGLPTMIYNFYNLDPEWKKGMQANRVLLLEPSHFRKYPVSSQTLDFILKLSKNIKSLEVYVGEFDELVSAYGSMDIYYKEHPLSMHYKGTMENRDWMFNVRGYYPSFFGFWKKCKKELNY